MVHGLSAPGGDVAPIAGNSGAEILFHTGGGSTQDRTGQYGQSVRLYACMIMNSGDQADSDDQKIHELASGHTVQLIGFGKQLDQFIAVLGRESGSHIPFEFRQD